MLKNKLLYTFIAVCLTIVAFGTISASAKTYGDLTYSISNGKITITDCNESATTVKIPSEIDGYPVTTIGNSAFYYCTSLKSITIPNSVTSIGVSAFSGCSSLTSITIPNSVTSIGVSAFSGCSSLTSITIPNSVTSIGNIAFNNCTSLTSIIIPDSVTSIGDKAFNNCTSLTSIAIGNGVTNIGEYAFYNCAKLTKVNINDISAWCNIKFSGYYANPLFYAKLLYLNESIVLNLEIPECVTSISACTFSGCTSLTSINIPDGVTSIGGGAFYGCENLTSINIPDGVTSIGSGTFYGCTSLTSINIPDGVTSIYDGTFGSCTSLTSITVDANNQYYSSDERGVLFNKDKTTLIRYPIGNTATSYTIPDSVTSIGDSAFYNCTSVTNITIPDSVTSIGDEAFYNTGCYYKSSNWENDVLYIGNHLIEAMNTLSGSYIIREGTKTILSGAFSSCDSLTSITIPNSVTSIGDYAFNYCRSLTSITIPNSVINIGERAFDYCTNLKAIAIGNGVTSIGKSAFYYCPALTKVIINDISAWCNIEFSDKKSNPLYNATEFYLNAIPITNLEIPVGVTNISEYAFFKCTGLTSITIPDSVTSIGKSAFEGCTNLNRVNINDISAWCGIKFFDYLSNPLFYANNLYLNESLITNLEIPENVVKISSFAFINYSNLTNITIPDSVTSIENDAFNNTGYYNNSSNWENGVLYIDNHLIKAKNTISSDYSIQEGTKTIANSAFYMCTNLTSITIPDSISNIGKSAFENCDNYITTYYNGSKSSFNKISIGSNNEYLLNSNIIYYRPTIIFYDENESIIKSLIIENNCIPSTNLPNKTGYTLELYTDPQFTYNFDLSTPIFENTSLYCKYIPNKYVITIFDIDNLLSVVYNTNYIIPPQAKAGFNFVGYYTDKNGNGTRLTSNNGSSLSPYLFDNNITAYPYFVRKTNTIGVDGRQFAGIGDSSIKENIAFLTDVSAQYLVFSVKFPDYMTLSGYTSIDFEDISKESEITENGYTTVVFTCMYDYVGGSIPKNAEIIPVELDFKISKTAPTGDAVITVFDAVLIGETDTSLDTIITKVLRITKKLAESIEILGKSTIDKAEKFTAIISPAHTTDKSVSWYISDDTIAEISQDGTITPKKNGSVTITAKTNDGSEIFAQKVINVIAYAKIDSVEFDDSIVTMSYAPDTRKYIVYVNSNATSITITPTFSGGGALRPNGSGIWISGRSKEFALNEGQNTIITLNRENVTDMTNCVYTVEVIKCGKTKTTVSEDKKTFTITPENLPNSSKIILALYGENGEFIETKVCENIGGIIKINTTKNYKTAKVIALLSNNTLKPLCDFEIFN